MMELKEKLVELAKDITDTEIEDFSGVSVENMEEFFAEREKGGEIPRAFDRLLKITNPNIREQIVCVIDDVCTIVDYVDELIHEEDYDTQDIIVFGEMKASGLFKFIELADKIDMDMGLHKVEPSRVIPEREVLAVLVSEVQYFKELIEDI